MSGGRRIYGLLVIGVMGLVSAAVTEAALEDRTSFKILVVSQKGDDFVSHIRLAAQDLKTVRGKLEVVPFEYSGNFDAERFAKWAENNAASVEGALLSLGNKDAASTIARIAAKKLPDLSFWIFPYVNDLEQIGMEIPSSVYFLDTNVENFLSLLSAQIQKPLSCRTTRFRFSLPSSEKALESRLADSLHLNRVEEGSRGCGTRFYRETKNSPSILGRENSRVKGKFDCVIAYGDRSELRSCVMAEMQFGKASLSTRFVYASAPPYDGEAPSLPDDFLSTGNHWSAAIIQLGSEEAKDLESRFKDAAQEKHKKLGRREFLAWEAASMADTLVDYKRRGKPLQLKTFASVLGEVRRTSKSPFPFRPFFLNPLGPLSSHDHRQEQMASFEPDPHFTDLNEN